MENKVFMKQTHSTKIFVVNDKLILEQPLHIIHGVDGLITMRKNTGLISHGADCALVAFWDKDTIGVCHAGWRGFVNGMFDKMLRYFKKDPHVFIGPFLHSFEIQKDECYFEIRQKLGAQYFQEKSGKIIFNFKGAVENSFNNFKYVHLDNRSTYDHPELASWRRDKKKGDGTQNRLVIWRDSNNEVTTKLFLPGEKYSTSKC